MQEISWSEADARRLKMLRLEAGYDLVQFSRLSSVSVAQITQLEESGDSLFYSARIKYAVGKRLTLLLLKSQQSLPTTDPLIDETPRGRSSSSQSHINAIVELSRRDLDAKPIKDFLMQAVYQISNLLRSKYLLSSMGMLVLMLSVWLYEHHADEQITAPHFEVDTSLRHDALSVVTAQWQRVEPFLDWTKAFFQSEQTSSPQAFASEEMANPKSLQLIEPPKDLMKPLVEGQTQGVQPTETHPGPNANPGGNGGINVGVNAPSEQGCSLGVEAPEVSPSSAHKPGNYVYLVAMVDTTVCLQDGQNKISRLSLSSGASQTVLGTSPWKVTLKGADEAKIFYQGQRIQPPTSGLGPQTFTLIEYKP
jgi:transcriptional regulator with XRE-family HTH domain